MFEIKEKQIVEIHVSNGQDISGVVTEVGDFITISPPKGLESQGEMHVPISGISYIRVMGVVPEEPAKATRKKR